MKNYIYIFSFLSILFWSCSNDELENEVSNQSFVSSFSTKSAGDAFYDVLGYGYDCTFSDFKGAVYSKARVIDLDRFKSGNG